MYDYDDDEFEFEMIEDEIEDEYEERRRQYEKKVREANRRSQCSADDVSGAGCLTGIVMMCAVVALMIIFPG